MTFSFLAIAGFVTAFASVVALTPGVARLARSFGWVDAPDGRRKLHRAPTPSIGGLSIFGGVAIGLILLAGALGSLPMAGAGLPLPVYLGGALMMGVGLVDDVSGVGFKTKLALQTAIAVLVVAGGVLIDLNGLPVVGGRLPFEPVWAFALTVVWIVGITNAVNLIDGVDGLAAGAVAIAFMCMAVVHASAGEMTLALVAAVFAGALGGFLVFNFNPASIFMGDSGSLFLGYSIAVYSVARFGAGDVLFAPAVPVLALGLPLLDTALSMGRRLAGRHPVCAADRDHIHHRMVDRMPVRKAVLVLYGVAASFGVLAIVAGLSSWTGLSGALAAGSLLALGVLLRLGYVRMPYAPPELFTLRPLPDFPGTVAPEDVPSPGDGATCPPPERLASHQRQSEAEAPSVPL